MTEDKKDKYKWVIPTISTIISLSLIIYLWRYNYNYAINLPCDERGTFGDMFGAVNALFSGLAFAGIIITILLQMRELRYQRDELKETREEFKTQNETLKIQRFENTFFNLLNLHHQIVDGIDHTYNASTKAYRGESAFVTQKGRDVFRRFYNSMVAEIKKEPLKYIEVYLLNYEKRQTDFGHYFRNLYRMIKLVDKTDFFYNKEVDYAEVFELKYNYTSIIRAQLSDYELLWLFYNCLSENGEQKFKPLIEKYSILKNMPFSKLADEKHKYLYNAKAFTPAHYNK